MSKLFLSALTAALLIVSPQVVPAQAASPASTEPVVVVSFSGYEEVFKDIEHIGTLIDNPKLREMAEAAVNLQFDGLPGLDKQKPWGVAIAIDPQQLAAGQLQPDQLLVGYAFVPVTDLDQLTAALAPMVGSPTDAGNGVLQFDADEQPVFVKQAGGWAFISITPEALAEVPSDPAALLDGMNQEYDLAVRLNVSSVPPELRDLLMELFKSGALMGPMGEEFAKAFSAAPNAAQTLEQIRTALDELETLTFGFALDSSSSSAYFDYVITAAEGTQTAQQMAQLAQATTDFAGFLLPGAAVTLNASAQLGPAEIARAKTSLTQARANALADLDKQPLGSAERQLAKKLVQDLFDVFEATVDTGRTDGAMALVLDPDAVTLVAGAHLGDTAKLDALIKDLAKQIIAEEPQAAGAINLDAEAHQGVRFHRLALPTQGFAANLPVLPQLVGDTLELIIGIDPQSAYLAVGRDASAKLKQAIDQSKAQPGKAASPMRLSIATTPIVNFVGSVAGQEAGLMVGILGEMLKQAGDKDHLTVTATAIPNGMRVRTEMEEGLIKVIGSLPTMMMGMGRPGF